MTYVDPQVEITYWCEGVGSFGVRATAKNAEAAVVIAELKKALQDLCSPYSRRNEFSFEGSSSDCDFVLEKVKHFLWEKSVSVTYIEKL